VRSPSERTCAGIVLAGAIFLGLVAGAQGATSIRPAPGAPDPRLMVITAADIGGAKVSSQHYYKDTSFPSVISYSREFDAGRVGSAHFVYLDTEAEVGASPDTTARFLTTSHKAFATKAFATEFAREIESAGGIGLVKVTGVGHPRSLGAGPGSFDVVITMRILGVRTDAHFSVFAVERSLGALVLVGEPARRVRLGAMTQLAKIVASRMTAQLAPRNTALPLVSGTPQAAQTLTATAGTWAGAAPTFTYQWQRCLSTGECLDIPGATGQTYEATWMDVNRTVRVVVTATTAVGSATATSAATPTVAAAPKSQWPTNASLPTISGTLRGGETLTATTGTWTGNPTTFFFGWQRCDTTSAPACLPTGGREQSYILTGADVDHLMLVYVTACNAAGCGSGRSATTSVVM